MENTFFDSTYELPSKEIKKRTESLIGFEDKFSRVKNSIQLILRKDELELWRDKFHKSLQAVESISDMYPLIIFSGDVGTGKTAFAEGMAERITRELQKTGYFLRLSTRVRGQGLHGEMGNLVNEAFSQLKKQAGKRRLSFLLIDEADAIATTRSTQQMHQEEKAGVNTLIQKIDELRETGGRAIVIMATNRLHFLDEAIIRRAGVVIKFDRPDDNERRELFTKDLECVFETNEQLENLVKLTGPDENNGVGYSYSDLRLKVFPEAIARVFPSKPLTFDTISEVLKDVQPSPKIK
ncbi:AAA family ATPase [Halocola ammonii]